MDMSGELGSTEAPTSSCGPGCPSTLQSYLGLGIYRRRVFGCELGGTHRLDGGLGFLLIVTCMECSGFINEVGAGCKAFEFEGTASAVG